MTLLRGGIALATITVTLAGCGPDIKEVALVRVRGVVTLDDEPLEKAVVIFESEDNSFSFAETDSRGRYDLRFDSETRGVTPGRKTVRISMNRRLVGLNATDEGGPNDRAGSSFHDVLPERLPERYNIQSKLAVDVTEENNTFDFNLRSDPTASAPSSGQSDSRR